VERAEVQGRANRPTVKSFRDFSSVKVECETLGASPVLGSLSVPPAWPTAAPRPGDPLPAVKGKVPGLTYQDKLMGVMTGQYPGIPAPEASLAEEA
jgi:hypothetical protein